MNTDRFLRMLVFLSSMDVGMLACYCLVEQDSVFLKITGKGG